MSKLDDQFVLDILNDVKKTNDKIINNLEEFDSVPREMLIEAFKNSNNAIDVGISSINYLYNIREIISSYNRS